MENFKATLPEMFKYWEDTSEGVRIIGGVLLALIIFVIAIKVLNFILGFLSKGLGERAAVIVTLIIAVIFLQWYFEGM